MESSIMSHKDTNPKQVVQNIRDAFNKRITLPVTYRLQQLKNFIKFLQLHEEEIVKSMHEDLRKHREEARLEIFIALNHIRYLIDNVKKWTKPEKVSKRFVDIFDEMYMYPDPYGVVLIMGSWNVPLLTLLPAAGAIAAGNCVVIKPSHNSPAFGEMLAKLLPEFLDPSTYPVFLGDIKQTNLLLDQRFDYIYYTGSTNVGKIVHLAANKYLTPTTLELGGKNPVYIDSSANLKLTAERVIWGKCFNSGQICIAPDHILCSKHVEKEFIEHAKIALKKFYGDNLKKCCPIVNHYHFERLTRLLNGLEIATGGYTDPLKNYIEPTIVTDVKLDHPVMQEEIFGPILPIITVQNLEEAVNVINQQEKPLALYIFTTDAKVTDYVLKNTSCGGLTVNDTLVHLIAESLPFGGVGFSGMGCYKGKASFDTFVHKKSVLVKNFWGIIERISKLRYPPYSRRKWNFLEFLLQYRHGLSLGSLNYVVILLLGFVIFFIFFYLVYPKILDELIVCLPI